MRWVVTFTTVAVVLGCTSSLAAPPAPVEPPEVDTDSLTASIRLREGLRILERYETFRLVIEDHGIVVETEPEPADSIRLDALGWESGSGMQDWTFKLSPLEDGSSL